MRLAQEHIQRLAGGVGMAEKEQFLHHHMDAPVAGVAEGDEVFHGVILRLARNSLPHPVDVVDVKLCCGATFSAGVAIAGKNGLLVAAKGNLGLRALSVLMAERAALAAFNGSRAIDLSLAWLAALLRTRQKRVRETAVDTWPNGSASNRTGFASCVLSPPHVQLGAGYRSACHAEALHGRSRRKGSLAPAALFGRVAASRLPSRFHLARTAAFDVAAVGLKAKAAIDAINGPIVSLFHHRQNVVSAYANG